MTLNEMHSARITSLPLTLAGKTVLHRNVGHFSPVIWIKLKEISQLHFVIINREMNIFSLTFLYTPTILHTAY